MQLVNPVARIKVGMRGPAVTAAMVGKLDTMMPGSGALGKNHPTGEFMENGEEKRDSVSVPVQEKGPLVETKGPRFFSGDV